MVNTKQVADRRKLRFEAFDSVMHEVESLAVAERQGTLRATGNWTLGQTIGHLAFWANAPFHGYPGMTRAPWPIRLVVLPFKKSLLNKKLPAGGRLPRVADGTYGVEPTATDEAIPQLRQALGRLAKESPTVPNLIFGMLTHDEWIKLNLRHAELHLSFFHPS